MALVFRFLRKKAPGSLNGTVHRSVEAGEMAPSKEDLCTVMFAFGIGAQVVLLIVVAHTSREAQRAMTHNSNVVVIASLPIIEGMDKLRPEIDYLALPTFRDRPHPLVMRLRARVKEPPEGFNRIR